MARQELVSARADGVQQQPQPAQHRWVDSLAKQGEAWSGHPVEKPRVGGPELVASCGRLVFASLSLPAACAAHWDRLASVPHFCLPPLPVPLHEDEPPAAAPAYQLLAYPRPTRCFRITCLLQCLCLPSAAWTRNKLTCRLHSPRVCQPRDWLSAAAAR